MKISIFILPPFLAGLYTLILGLFVLLKNKSSVLNRSFFLLCLSVLVWQFGNVFVRSSGTSDLAIFWARIVYFGVAFIPAAFYHFSVEFNKLRKQKIWVLFMYLLCCLLLFLVMRNNFIISSYETAWGRRTLAGRSHAIFLTFWFLPLILALFNFYYGYRKAISPFERQRRRFLLVSSFISCLAAIDFLPNYGISVPFLLSYIPLMFFLASATYAVIHYRILDVEVILKKVSIMTFLFAAAVVLIYIAPFYLRPYLFQLWGKNWIFFPVSLAFLIGLVLFHLIKFVKQMEEDELSKKFAYRPILKKEAERISVVRNTKELLAYITHDLSSWVRLDYVGILVWDNHIKEFVLIRSLTRSKNRKKIPIGLTLAPDNPLVVELLRTRKPLVYSELEYYLDTKTTLFEERDFIYKIADQMKRLGAEITLPSFCEERLLAIINLGRKLNPDDTITHEDLELFSSLSNHIARAIHDFKLKEEKIQLIVASQNILITTIEAKDHYTRGHTDRVARYSTIIGNKLEKSLRLYPNGLSNLNWAAQLHDVGKIGIPDTILLKNGELDKEEWREIKEHTINGLNIISPMREWLGEDICAGILHHHENFDGSGYPFHQKGEEIHLFARIIRLADAFDAMVTDRPYRPALSKEEAMKEIKKYKGIHFDPRIVDVMESLYNNGEI